MGFTVWGKYKKCFAYAKLTTMQVSWMVAKSLLWSCWLKAALMRWFIQTWKCGQFTHPCVISTTSKWILIKMIWMFWNQTVFGLHWQKQTFLRISSFIVIEVCNNRKVSERRFSFMGELRQLISNLASNDYENTIIKIKRLLRPISPPFQWCAFVPP